MFNKKKKLNLLKFYLKIIFLYSYLIFKPKIFFFFIKIFKIYIIYKYYILFQFK
jgi:hypothetical protein